MLRHAREIIAADGTRASEIWNDITCDLVVLRAGRLLAIDDASRQQFRAANRRRPDVE